MEDKHLRKASAFYENRMDQSQKETCVEFFNKIYKELRQASRLVLRADGFFLVSNDDEEANDSAKVPNSEENEFHEPKRADVADREVHEPNRDVGAEDLELKRVTGERKNVGDDMVVENPEDVTNGAGGSSQAARTKTDTDWAEEGSQGREKRAKMDFETLISEKSAETRVALHNLLVNEVPGQLYCEGIIRSMLEEFPTEKRPLSKDELKRK